MIQDLFNIYTIVGMVILLFLSCERFEPVNIGGVDCYECYNPKPEWVILNIKVTINDQNQKVPLIIYKGNVEDGNVDWYDTTGKSDFWVEVKPDQYYSVKAEYKDGNKTIFAIDGDKIKLKYSEDSCDEPCYYSTGGYIDVQLKANNY
jgi:hypothetical protein